MMESCWMDTTRPRTCWLWCGLGVFGETVSIQDNWRAHQSINLDPRTCEGAVSAW